VNPIFKVPSTTAYAFSIEFSVLVILSCSCLAISLEFPVLLRTMLDEVF
jgi:hypothetical protein